MVKKTMNPISKALGQHYAEKFSQHGPSSQGVDWGADESRMLLRYNKMLSVADWVGDKPSLLDVGCGYGGLQSYAISKNIDLDYTGIDVAGNMIEWATANVSSGNFIHGDILDYQFNRQFDYVVCNGILTQKLETTTGFQMDQFAAQLIRQMFSLCTIGIAFNVMTTKVNYFSNNLYYRNPAELFSWCLSEITPHVKLDHSYPLYEYTIYLYRNPV